MEHDQQGIPIQVEVKLKTNMKYVELCVYVCILRFDSYQ